MKTLKVTKKQGLTLPLKNTFLEKTPPAFLGLGANKRCNHLMLVQSTVFSF